jgi:hypothetical protein
MLAAGYETAARRDQLAFHQGSNWFADLPGGRLGTSLARSRSIKRPAPRFYKRRLKASPARRYAAAIKISPKTAIKNNNDDGQKVTSWGA